MRKVGILSFLSLCLLVSNCKKEEPSEVEKVVNYKKSGFVVAGGQNGGASAVYFDSLPSGTINLSQGKSFQQFFPYGLIEGALLPEDLMDQAVFPKCRLQKVVKL